MTHAEHCVLLLLVCCIKTKQSSQIINFVTHDCKSALPDNWLVMHYLKNLKEAHQLLVLSEATKHNDLVSEYMTVLLQQIYTQEIIPVTNLIIMTDKCSQGNPVLNGDLILLLSTNEPLALFQNAKICITHWKTTAHFIITILHTFLDDDQTTSKALALSIFQYLWIKERLLNVLIVTTDSHFSCGNNENNNSIKVWMYNPFELNTNNSRGNIYNFEYGHDHVNKHTDKRLRNLHGYPLHVSMFPQYPTAILVSNVENNSIIYEGMDGYILSTMAQYFNFKFKIHTSYGNNRYGLALQNGSILGSLADVVYGRTEISFNSRFVMWYGTDNIDFSIPVTSDKLCIIAPKAKRIPKWKNMLMCYKPEVWLSLLLIYFTCVVCFYFLQKFHLQNQSIGCLPAFDMFQVFVLSPVSHPPRILMQQLLFASCLLFSLVMMNIFQGLLVTNITSPNYGTDIHTLEQLHDSNLQILTGSSSTRDMLKNGGYIVTKKFKVFEGTREEMIQHVLKSDAAITERESSVRFLVTKHILPDGTALMHMVDECPGYYYLAYILPKHTPYLQVFNSFFRKVIECGLTEKWFWDSIDIKTKLTYRKSQLKPKTLKLFSLSDLQLAFYILATGLMLSSLVFGAEISIGIRNFQQLNK